MYIEKRLEDLGIMLPEAPTPVANYVPVRRTGNLLFLSGAGPFVNGKPVVTGKLGKDLSEDQGYQAARLAALNLIAQLKNELGDLDRVTKIVKIMAFVSSDPSFTKQPLVMNGASDLFVEVFGEAGKHARSAVAAPVLPLDIAVEVEITVEVK